MMEKVKKHHLICEDINHLYQQKNFAYGDAFAKSLGNFGPQALNLILDHKMARLQAITDNPDLVGDESYTDTVRDIANYCIIALVEMTSPAAVEGREEGIIHSVEEENLLDSDKGDLEEELQEYSKAELLQVAADLGVSLNKKTSKDVILENLLKLDSTKVIETLDKLFTGVEEE